MKTFPKRPKATTKLNLGSRLRNFVFTLNNPSEDNKAWFAALEPDDRYRFGLGQLEKGKEGTTHIQGYIELKRPTRFQALKKEPGFEKAHIERRRGTAQQAADYCRKTDSRIQPPNDYSFEFGSISKQGVRKDSVSNVVAAIAEGKTLDEIEEEFPATAFLHEQKLINAFIDAQGPRMLTPDKNNVLIYHGPTGTGKTTTAWREYPEAYKGVWPTGGRWWWPNYRGQDVIIFDEFRENLSYQQMLALFDLHPMSIEYKGGNTQMISKKIILTTSRDPCTWYKKVQDKSELQRRINQNATIYDFSCEGKYPDFIKQAREEEFKFDPFIALDFSNN